MTDTTSKQAWPNALWIIITFLGGLVFRYSIFHARLLLIISGFLAMRRARSISKDPLRYRWE